MASDGGVLLTSPDRHWSCPCGRTAVTKAPAAGTATSQLHPCSLAGGLLTPYAPAGVGPVKVTAVVRQDHVQHSGLSAGITETLRYDDRARPIMSVVTEYADTSHTALFVPGININMGAVR